MDHYLIIVIIITRDGVFVIRSELLLKTLTQAVSKFIAYFPCRDLSNVCESVRVLSLKKKESEIVVQKREIRQVMRRRQRNIQLSLIHMQSFFKKNLVN